MDYTLADLTKAVSMFKNVEKKEEYIISFTKEDDGLWYVDYPNWPFDHSHLQMVSGADKLCELLSYDGKHTRISVIPSKEDKDIKTTVYSVLSKILGLSVKMVIRDSTRQKLRNTHTFPKVTANYVIVDNRPQDQTTLTHYEVSCKTTRKKTYENLPNEELLVLMNEQPEDAISKKITVQFNKNENVKMTYELNEAQVLAQTLIEETNGYEIALDPEEVATMHEAPNVKHHLGDIIARFLSNEAPMQHE